MTTPLKNRVSIFPQRHVEEERLRAKLRSTKIKLTRLRHTVEEFADEMLAANRISPDAVREWSEYLKDRVRR